MTDQEPAAESEPDRPPVRLVREEESEEEIAPAVSIPVPWAPTPSRPKRTPPQPAVRNQREDSMPPDSPSADPATAQHTPAVQLTPEELAALLGKPPSPAARLPKEQRL